MEGETRPKSDENLANPNKESTKEQLPSKLSSKTKIIIASVCVAVVVVVIVVVVVVVVTKKNNDDEENVPSYYLSDRICETIEGKEYCYRKVNVSYEHYIFDLSDEVSRTHVSYRNRYGIQLAADLYTPKNLDTTKKYSGIVIGPPYGGVKEQGPGVYANELAKRGFVALTFDPSFNGESGGLYKHVSSSDIFVEDFSAGVDYLGTLNYINRERIGGIGICGSGGFILGAAAVDARIKAVVTSALYDIPDLNGINFDNDEWQSSIASLKTARWNDVDKGTPSYTTFYIPDREYENIGPNIGNLFNWEEWSSFYSTKTGHHPRSIGGFTDTSFSSIGNIPVTTHIDKISPRPILFITGDIAHSKEYSEQLYAKAKEPKELYVVNGNTKHVDLYYDTNKIPLDKIEDFFNSYLNGVISEKNS